MNVPPYRPLALAVGVAILAVAVLPLDAPHLVLTATGVGLALCVTFTRPGRAPILLKRAAMVGPFLVLLAIFQIWRPITADSIECFGAVLPAGPVRAATFLLKTVTVAGIGLAWGDLVTPAGIARTMQRFRLPAGLVATTFLTTGFTSTLRHEWDSVRLAGIARGLNHAPWRFQLRHLGGAMVSVLVRSLRRGDRVALAMRARGYRGELPASIVAESRDPGRAFTALALAAILLVIALFAHRIL